MSTPDKRGGTERDETPFTDEEISYSFLRRLDGEEALLRLWPEMPPHSRLRAAQLAPKDVIGDRAVRMMLLEEPALLNYLASRKGLAPQAVDEILRWLTQQVLPIRSGMDEDWEVRESIHEIRRTIQQLSRSHARSSGPESWDELVKALEGRKREGSWLLEQCISPSTTIYLLDLAPRHLCAIARAHAGGATEPARLLGGSDNPLVLLAEHPNADETVWEQVLALGVSQNSMTAVLVPALSRLRLPALRRRLENSGDAYFLLAFCQVADKKDFARLFRLLAATGRTGYLLEALRQAKPEVRATLAKEDLLPLLQSENAEVRLEVIRLSTQLGKRERGPSSASPKR